MIARQIKRRRPGGPAGAGRPGRAWPAAVLALCLLAPPLAADAGDGSAAAAVTVVHTNGRGGGYWSDPATWLEGRLPAADEMVEVLPRDRLVFDLADHGEVNCRGIYIDPGAKLAFGTGARGKTLRLGGVIENFGAIRIDQSDPESGPVAIHLQGPREERRIDLRERSSLLVYGRRRPPGEEPLVLIASGEKSATAADPAGVITATAQVMLDVHHARLHNMEIRAAGIDNTGSAYQERLNLVRNVFSGQSRVRLESCDTPAVNENFFIGCPERAVGHPALTLVGCPLGEVRRNVFEAGYTSAVVVRQVGEVSAVDNVIRGATRAAIDWQGDNAIIRGNVIEGAPTGLLLSSAGGVVEDTVIRAAQTAVRLDRSQVHFVNLAVEDPAGDDPAISVDRSSLSLLNANLGPDDFLLRRPGRQPWVEKMYYLVVGVTGEAPRGASVGVRTADPPEPLPEGAADLNIRNAPAMLDRRGLTPLPGRLNPLIVRGWSLVRREVVVDGRVSTENVTAPAPTYRVTLQAPPEDPDSAPRELATLEVTPGEEWFRAVPAEPQPTLRLAVP